MTAGFMELSGAGQGACCTLMLLALCEGLCAALIAGIYRAPAKHLALCLTLSLADFAALCAMLDGMKRDFQAAGIAAERLVWRAPAWLLTLLMALSAAWIGRELRRLRRWRRGHISGTSVKESLDWLPSGLCFYVQGGMPRLVNVRMNELCRALTGGPLNNGAEFWQRLTAGDVLPDNCVLQKGGAPVVQTADGRVWSFERCAVGAGLAQIVASDITQEQEMNARLAQENRRLEEMNRRLRRYGGQIRELTRERETLLAKARIHDEFGQALLAARRLATQLSGAQQRTEVLRMWRQNLTLMEHMSEPEPPSRGFEGLVAAAKAIGMRVTIRGEQPPADAPCMEILENAAHECLTNAVRHAGGTELCVRMSQAEGRVSAVFTNDGAPPGAEVTEGGGLSSLRRRVESAGGEMRVRSAPRFALTVELPLESEEWK